MLFAPFFFQAAGGGDVYEVGNAIRFNGQQSMVGPVPRPTGDFTFSCWFKMGTTVTSLVMTLLSTDINNKYDLTTINATPANVWRAFSSPLSNAQYRDPSAWYHLVFQNINEVTTLYVNGVEQAAPSPVTTPNGSSNLVIGANFANSEDDPLKGYLAQVFMVEGTEPPTAFGEFNNEGVWVPIEPENLTYGTNGFALLFDDVNAPGADRSGNGNDFTTTAFVTDPTNPLYTQVTDSPTSNFAVLSPLYPGANNSDPNNADLTSSSSDFKPTVLGISGNVGVDGTSPAWDGTKAAWTYTGNMNFGQLPNGFTEYSAVKLPSASIKRGADGFQALEGPGSGTIMIEENPVPALTGPLTPFKAYNLPTDIVNLSSAYLDYGKAYDTVNLVNSNGTGGISVAVSEDGVVWTIIGQNDVAWGDNETITYDTSSNNGNPIRYVRWQYPGMNTAIASSVPTGQTLIETAQLAFPAGLWWTKSITNDGNNQLTNSVSGLANTRNINAGNTGAFVAPDGDAMAWCWKYDSANPQKYGFNIVEFQSDGSESQTVASGLTDPDWFIVYGQSGDVMVSAKAVGLGNFQLNANSPFSAGSVGCTGTSDVTVPANSLPGNCVLLVWQNIAGYSQAGVYDGNASTDGPFVYTGFRPAFVMLKTVTNDQNWIIFDTTRDTFNPAPKTLSPNTVSAQTSDAGEQLDIVSNGFKCRGSGVQSNSSSQMFYVAFAEHPFGGSNVAPVTAR